MRAVLQISRVTEGWLWADDDTGPPEEVTLGNKRLSSMEGVLCIVLNGRPGQQSIPLLERA